MGKLDDVVAQVAVQWCKGGGPVLGHDVQGNIVIKGFAHAADCGPEQQAREEAAARAAVARADSDGMGGDAGTRRDSDDQRRLRGRVCNELAAVMERHDVGGVVFVISRESGAWRFVIPRWAGLTIEGPGMLRLRISSRTPALQEIANSTMHLIAMMRDMCAETGVVFMRLFDDAERALGGPGSITHAVRPMSKPSREGN